MSKFQPAPTYADPVLIDEKTKKSSFNPLWLNWFLTLAQNLGAGGAGSGSGTVTSVAATGANGIVVGGSPVTGAGTLALSLGTLNVNTTGSAATLTTPRAINGVNFDGSAAITIPAAAATLTGGATFSPTVFGGTVPGTTTYTVQVAHATQIGNYCFLL